MVSDFNTLTCFRKLMQGTPGVLGYKVFLCAGSNTATMDGSDMVGKTITRPCPPTRIQVRGVNVRFPQPKPLVHIRKPGIEYETYRVGMDMFDPNALLLLRDNDSRLRLRKITTFVNKGTLWETLENDISFEETDIKYVEGIRKVYGHTLR